MSYPLLERINAPGEIKNLPASDMPALCEEIRQFLIKSVSETGGHLSSNLGVMNLLPLPALDGGRLLFEIIELIRRKPIKREIEGYIHFAGRSSS